MLSFRYLNSKPGTDFSAGLDANLLMIQPASRAQSGARLHWLCEPESAGWRDGAPVTVDFAPTSTFMASLEVDLRFVRAL